MRELYRRLRADGFRPWLDEKELLPGQEWQEEIPVAVRNCDVVIVCLSKDSVSKEGYLQREIRDALYVAEEKPQGTIFIIPIRIDDVEVPNRLSRWQWANFFSTPGGHGYEDGYHQLVRALNIRAKAIGLTILRPEAMYDLGQQHYKAQNYEQAHDWFQQAADAGHPGAMNMLGILYNNAFGVLRDYHRARLWQEKAANAGNSSAMYNLGLSYEFSRGVPRDIEKAREWYQKAATGGNERAREKLNLLLSPTATPRNRSSITNERAINSPPTELIVAPTPAIHTSNDSRLEQSTAAWRKENPDEWDVFISHASEDKNAIARPLAEALKAQGLRVWYDEFSLTVGDSLRKRIDQGLSNSHFGIVILSRNFFEKHWPEQELNGLATREIDGQKVILPIWHGVVFHDVRQFSPMLADRLAVSTDKGLEYVIQELLKVIKPPEISNVNQRLTVARIIRFKFKMALSIGGTPPLQWIKLNANYPVIIERIEYMLSNDVCIAGEDLSIQGESVEIPLNDGSLLKLWNTPRSDRNKYDHSGPAKIGITVTVDEDMMQYILPVHMEMFIQNNTVYRKVVGSKTFNQQIEIKTHQQQNSSMLVISQKQDPGYYDVKRQGNGEFFIFATIIISNQSDKANSIVRYEASILKTDMSYSPITIEQGSTDNFEFSVIPVNIPAFSTAERIVGFFDVAPERYGQPFKMKITAIDMYGKRFTTDIDFSKPSNEI